MKIVLDTYVFASGIFFGGPPGQILEAWHDGRVTLVVSLEILDEYQRVGEELAVHFPEIDLSPFLELLALTGEFYDCPPLAERVCTDPDDDKFFACALASGCSCIVSGDKHLLQASGYGDVEVLRPRQFVEQHL